LRGGYWYNDAKGCRAAWRHDLAPVGRGSGIGFRVVVRLPSTVLSNKK